MSLKSKIDHAYGVDEIETFFKGDEVNKYINYMKQYGYVAYHNNDINDECDCENYGGIGGRQ